RPVTGKPSQSSTAVEVELPRIQPLNAVRHQETGGSPEIEVVASSSTVANRRRASSCCRTRRSWIEGENRRWSWSGVRYEGDEQ
ncbi:hypothetical protein V2J09_010723, partial [Rumex salicifolius]